MIYKTGSPPPTILSHSLSTQALHTHTSIHIHPLSHIKHLSPRSIFNTSNINQTPTDKMVSFLATLLLTGTALGLPNPSASYGNKQPSCMAAGQKVSSWKVENFDYHASYIFTTPAHQNSWGYVNFTLSNPALNYKPVC